MAHYVEIRCPNDRPHSVTQRDGSVVTYPTCGALMGGINEDDRDDSVYMRCPLCRVSWLVSVDFYGEISMTKETGKIPFIDKLKEVD